MQATCTWPRFRCILGIVGSESRQVALFCAFSSPFPVYFQSSVSRLLSVIVFAYTFIHRFRFYFQSSVSRLLSVIGSRLLSVIGFAFTFNYRFRVYCQSSVSSSLLLLLLSGLRGFWASLQGRPHCGGINHLIARKMESFRLKGHLGRSAVLL